jgi:hypothetical protein
VRIALKTRVNPSKDARQWALGTAVAVSKPKVPHYFRGFQTCEGFVSSVGLVLCRRAHWNREADQATGLLRIKTCRQNQKTSELAGSGQRFLEDLI